MLKIHKRVNSLLNAWRPKLANSEKEYTEQLYRYLKQRVDFKIENRRTKRIRGKRYEDLLINNFDVIEMKTNFTQKEFNEIRTQIQDYCRSYKHITFEKLSLLQKIRRILVAFMIPGIDDIFGLKVFIVICGIKNEELLKEIKRTWKNSHGVYYYIKQVQ